MKLDASGAWQWTKQRGSSSYDSARALQLNASGLLVAGATLRKKRKKQTGVRESISLLDIFSFFSQGT